MDLSRAEALAESNDGVGLCRELSRLYPSDPALGGLPDLVAFAFGETTAMPRLPDNGAIFSASIAALKNFWLAESTDLRAHHRINRRTIGVDQDFLGARHDVADWTAAMALNHVLMNRIRPTRRAAVVGTMRDDGIYALEWVAHHLALGFEGLFVYTNDNADGSEHLLRRLADHRIITLIESETEGTVRPEVKAFEHAIHLLHELRDHEWVLFVDSDEFFQPGDRYGHSVVAVLNAVAQRFPDRPPAAILYEWLWYNSGMVFDRKPGLLMERFQHASPHWLTKPLVRLRDVVSMRRQHVPDIRPDGFMVNSVFDAVDPDGIWTKRPSVYDGGRINHYWPKSFEEFSLKKARGDALNLEEDEYRRDFSLFFDWNGPETPDTHHPVDPAFLASVQTILRDLRSLDGIAALEAEVHRRFRSLLTRYDAQGGLMAIYRTLNTQPSTFNVPSAA